MSDREHTDEMIKRRLSAFIAEQKKLAEPVSEDKRKKIAEKLNTVYDVFLENYEFKEGQLVEWKQGVKNRVRPRLREPAVIIKLLETPEFDTEKDAGTPYFKEPLDMIIGVLEEDEDNLLFFHVDKRRFKPFDGE
ncbi:hypothetical protein [Desulfonema magnum]|uniref:Uncharacterized protein n=1 Tax=Desulfonema magnum TaxID=45655 RepID=A0A975GSD0_9BACT|nr:hypothetical protein [Desulfonema magnum]QTA91904.1 Uncharacterized protein dnm_079770 [Desulfonema magnum]